MPKLMPYLLFDGTCREAMEFYRSCLAGELEVTQVKDSPAAKQMAASEPQKIIHARLHGDGIEISASDWLRADRRPVRGNTVCLYLSGGTAQQMREWFEKLAQGAEVTDPLREQFFGTYGALNDKFGVRWMFHTERMDEEQRR